MQVISRARVVRACARASLEAAVCIGRLRGVGVCACVFCKPRTMPPLPTQYIPFTSGLRMNVLCTSGQNLESLTNANPMNV